MHSAETTTLSHTAICLKLGELYYEIAEYHAAGFVGHEIVSLLGGQGRENDDILVLALRNYGFTARKRPDGMIWVNNHPDAQHLRMDGS